jgi:4-phytase / acid phosphatase
MHFRYARLLIVLALCHGSFLTAQPVDDTQLKQVIIFGRHSVRSPVAPNSLLNTFSVRPFPDFGVSGPGILTSNGKALETLLGGYYRLWLTREGLLTGKDPVDAASVYFRANVIERTIDTAKAFAAGLLPAASVDVNFYPPTESDPLFEAVGAGVAQLDQRKAIAAVKGRLGGSGQALTSAYASELALTRSVLFGYPIGQSPVPATPAGLIDVTTIPIDVTAGSPGAPVSLGGLMTLAMAADPFLMEYADGLPASNVGWGQLTVDGIGQTARFANLVLDLEFRTPYLAGVQSSNIASHVVRSMVQVATGNAMTGALGNPSTKVVLLVASDVNISGLAGLFRLEWLLPGYQANYCAPGGAVVLELRQSRSTGAYIVRASYIAQTLDQLRNRTVLTLKTPPASAPLFIPGCSARDATFDCPLANFVRVAKQAIDPQSADTVN